jgi:hypothetical protein
MTVSRPTFHVHLAKAKCELVHPDQGLRGRHVMANERFMIRFEGWRTTGLARPSRFPVIKLSAKARLAILERGGRRPLSK